MKSEEAKAEKEKAGNYLDTKRPVYGDLKTKWILIKSPVKEEVSSSGPDRVGREERNMQKWDGKTKNFPRFKKLWKENIIP